MFPQTPLSFTVELWYDGDWQNITSHVRHGDRIQITRGRRAESGRPEPGSCRLTLSNRDARYSPDNPVSPLYGKIGRNTAIRVQVDGDSRFIGEISAWPPQWTEGGKDVWVTIEASGILRRIDQRRAPLQSTLRRRVSSAASLVAYWPMEDAAGATSAYSPVQNVSPLRVSGFTFAADDALAGSDPLPTIASTASMVGVVPARTSTGQWTCTFLANMAAAPALLTRLLVINTNGTAAAQIVLAVTSTAIRISALDADSNETLLVGVTTPELYDSWVRIEITAQEIGANTRFRVGWVNLTSNSGYGTDNTIAGTSGAVTQVSSPFGAGVAGMGIGHLAVFSTATTTIYNQAERAFVGEAAHIRFQRLCQEEGINVGLVGSASAAMGPQRPGRLLDLLYEVVDADGGIIYESRDSATLIYRTRQSLYNQTPRTALDYRQHLVPGLQPTSDDQTTVNDMTVQRVNGSSARYVQSTGTLSVLDAPAGVGRYDQSATVNVQTDDVLPDMASWAVHLGTVDEPRYPAIPLNLARNYNLGALLAPMLIGDRVTVSNTPAWLPPDGIDVLVQGLSETIASTEWTQTLIGSPASPWTVAVADTTASWADTDGAVLDAAMTSTQTTALVHTTSGLPWTAAHRDCPVPVRVSGEVMRLDGPGPWLNANPYFDTNTTGWSVQNGTFAWSTDYVTALPLPAKGTVRITPNGTSATGGPVASLTPVGSIIPGVTYTVSLWAYSPAGWSGLQPAVNWHTAAGTYITTSSRAGGFNVPAAAWTYLEQSFTAPANASTASVLALHSNTPPVSAVWYAWAVRITPQTAGAATDSFTRTVSGGWGTADTGQAWTLTTGAASERSVDGSRGMVTVPNATIANPRFQTLAGLTLDDCEIRVRISAAQVSTGAAMIPSILVRFVDAANFYRARLHFSLGGVMSVSITRDVTQLGDAFLPYTYAAGDSFEMRVRIDGQRIRMRVWPTTSTESSAWSYETTVTTSPITSGLVGVTASGFAGNSNVNPAIAFDNFEIVTPQTFTVTRSMNRVVKALPAGADVRLATPAIVAL
ncbi:carbohydrate binding domain-containing protein [Streptomyces sp. NPDC016845]|uniref:carbohydrate binding domain-containing protein n=1 Tax=Streptomyces sp. NPDC016845 TaxID=3364972 RepID=UPI0037B05D8F